VSPVCRQCVKHTHRTLYVESCKRGHSCLDVKHTQIGLPSALEQKNKWGLLECPHFDHEVLNCLVCLQSFVLICELMHTHTHARSHTNTHTHIHTHTCLQGWQSEDSSKKPLKWGPCFHFYKILQKIWQICIFKFL